MDCTLLVPLCKVQIDWSTSTMSPKEYPKAGPLVMAEATADLRKSIIDQTRFYSRSGYGRVASMRKKSKEWMALQKWRRVANDKRCS